MTMMVFSKSVRDYFEQKQHSRCLQEGTFCDRTVLTSGKVLRKRKERRSVLCEQWSMKIYAENLEILRGLSTFLKGLYCSVLG